MLPFTILLSILIVCILPYQSTALSNSANIVDASIACGEGWYYAAELSTCYYLSSEKATFSDADVACLNIGGRLLTIFSDAEYDIVTIFTDQQDVWDYWIGLQPYEYEPYYRWVDERNANYTRWVNGIAPGHNDSNTCVEWVTYNGWMLEDCDNPLNYICKKATTLFNGRSITSPTGSGTVSSPDYPFPYDKKYYYYFDQPTCYNSYCYSDPPVYYNSNVFLSFDYIDIDSKTNIEIYDGNYSTPVVNVTSEYRRFLYQSKANQLQVIFQPGNVGNEKHIGWTLSYKYFVPLATKGCITSPLYPHVVYYGAQNYTYLANAPQGYGITYTVWDFDSEDTYYLLITTDHDGDVLYLTGRNVTTPLTIRTAQSKATIIWHNTEPIGVPFSRFNLTWVAYSLYG